MQTKQLGKSGIQVPLLGFGSMELRNMGESDSLYLANRVLDMGITLIDTSPDYRQSEEFIGKAVSHRRDEYLLATKCGCNIWSDKGGHIYTREQFQKNLDHSLKLLRTEYIDIWQIHGAVPGDFSGPMDDAIEFMREQKQAGKIGSVSISFKNGGAPDPLYPAGFSAEAFAHYLDYGFDSIQTVYGAMTRDCEGFITQAHEKGIGVIARGILNRYTPDYAAKLEASGLRELCEPGESVNGLLIRFAISHPGVSCAIVGSSNQEHMRENILAAERGPLSPELYAETAKRLEQAGFAAK